MVDVARPDHRAHIAGESKRDCREIDVGLGHVIGVIGQRVERDVCDDFQHRAIIKTGLFESSQFFVFDHAAMTRNQVGKGSQGSIGRHRAGATTSSFDRSFA